jgi:hypothetical protein
VDVEFLLVDVNIQSLLELDELSVHLGLGNQRNNLKERTRQGNGRVDDAFQAPTSTGSLLSTCLFAIFGFVKSMGGSSMIFGGGIGPPLPGMTTGGLCGCGYGPPCIPGGYGLCPGGS